MYTLLRRFLRERLDRTSILILLFVFSLLLSVLPMTISFPSVAAASDRGRVSVKNGTVVSDQGTLLRGVTMQIDAPGQYTNNAAMEPNNWKQVHDLKLNVVRFDVKLSTASGGAQSLNNQLSYLDKAVDFASQNGLYIAIENTTNPGNYNLDELKSFWSVVADRYKDRTHVLYEMTNEPVGWYPNNYSAQNIADLKSVYDIMRAKAPQTHIALWDFPNFQDAQTTINTIKGMSGIPYSNESVAFHYYDGTPDQIATVKQTYPLFMTEVTQTDGNGGGPVAVDTATHLGTLESLGVSWVSLEGKNGNFGTLQNNILSAMHSAGHDWPSDGGAATTTTPTATPSPSPTATPATTPSPSPTTSPSPTPSPSSTTPTSTTPSSSSVAQGALDRSGWTATASSNGNADQPFKALDGNYSTRWSTGTPQSAGQYFQVDMKSMKTFSKIVLDATGDENDYPRKYEVYVSSDGSNWGSAIASGAGSVITNITFPAQSSQYIKVVQTVSDPKWWSIREFYVYP